MNFYLKIQHQLQADDLQMRHIAKLYNVSGNLEIPNKTKVK
jgi:hypothetical protein